MTGRSVRLGLPSWCVGLFGAALAIVSTFVLSFVIAGINDKTAALEGEIAGLEEAFDRKWGTIRQAEEEAIAADVIAGLLAVSNADISEDFLFRKAAEFALATVRSLCQVYTQDGRCGTVQVVGQLRRPGSVRSATQVMTEAARLGQQLSDGDSRAFSRLRVLAKAEHLEALRALAKLRDQVAEKKLEAGRTMRDAAWWRDLQVMLQPARASVRFARRSAHLARYGS